MIAFLMASLWRAIEKASKISTGVEILVENCKV